MARVYSTKLFEGTGLGAGGTEVLLVPAGHVYVVRHMTARFSEVLDAAITGFFIHMASGAPLWTVQQFSTVALFAYQWGGRHVALSGDSVFFTSSDTPNWDLLISGYDLELP